jgi:protein-S-isoprenylcysteine O-methyltransferase Ste14
VSEFVVYTVLRILLLVASFCVVFGFWALVADSVPLLWVVVIAFVLSGVASYFLLNGPRTAFAARVEQRAARATAAFEDRRAREDVD